MQIFCLPVFRALTRSTLPPNHHQWTRTKWPGSKHLCSECGHQLCHGLEELATEVHEKKATQLWGIWQRECRSGRMQTRRGSEWQTGLSRICAPLISSGAASCHQKAHSGAEWLPIWRTSNTTVPAIKGRVLGTNWSQKNCTALRDRALLFKTNLFFCYSNFLCNSIVF